MPNERNIILELIPPLEVASFPFALSHSRPILFLVQSVPSIFMVKKEQASVRAVCVCVCVCYVSTFFSSQTSKCACARVCVRAEVICCVVRNSRRSINGAKTYDILRERRWRGHHVRICFGWLPFFRLPHVRHW